MFGVFRRIWLKAQALSCLQLLYQIPLKEPLGRDDDARLKAACAEASRIGGTQWDAAAIFMISAATDRLSSSPHSLSGDDRDLIAKAAGTTLGRLHAMGAPDNIRDRVIGFGEIYKAHPGHPKNTSAATNSN